MSHDRLPFNGEPEARRDASFALLSEAELEMVSGGKHVSNIKWTPGKESTTMSWWVGLLTGK